jgi:hypothetical protein
MVSPIWILFSSPPVPDRASLFYAFLFRIVKLYPNVVARSILLCRIFDLFPYDVHCAAALSATYGSPNCFAYGSPPVPERASLFLFELYCIGLAYLYVVVLSAIYIPLCCGSFSRLRCSYCCQIGSRIAAVWARRPRVIKILPKHGHLWCVALL